VVSAAGTADGRGAAALVGAWTAALATPDVGAVLGAAVPVTADGAAATGRAARGAGAGATATEGCREHASVPAQPRTASAANRQ
jgi:hypothetical protein